MLIVQMQEVVLPPDMRNAFERAIRQRYIELCGSEARAESYYREPDRKSNPMSHFNLRFEQAIRDAMDEVHVPPSIGLRVRLNVRLEG